MAFNVRSGRGGQSLAEINVTPFVDVVLVLLIIFMLTAHVMEYGVEVDVPKTRQVAETDKEMPVINVSSQAELFVNDQAVNINELPKVLEPMLGKNRGAYLRGDKAALWEVMAQVLAECSRAKISVSVVTQPLESVPKRR